jgi:uncharacterized membrane protein
VRLGIFQATKAEAAYAMARSLGINYLVVGQPERRAYQASLTLIAGRPDLFAPVFSNQALTVFRVEGAQD